MLFRFYAWLCIWVVLGIGHGFQITKKDRLCGQRLFDTVNLLCKGCFYDPNAAMRRKKFEADRAVPKARIVDDCCLANTGGCTYNYLKSYCCLKSETEAKRKSIAVDGKKL